MFELTLSNAIDKQSYFTELCKKLSPEIKQDKGVIAKENSNGRTHLAIAVNESKKEYYKAKILDFILFMIVDDYKFNYYKDNLKADASDNLVFESFLKAISIFDAESDKEVIKKQIMLSGELVIDSFFHFKLQMLKSRWEKTAGIINQNHILESKSAMIDVLKYLTTMSDSNSSLVTVSFSEKQITTKTLGSTKKFKNNFKGCSNFLTEMVRANPIKINISCTEPDELQEEVLDVLKNIFFEKINLINWF